MISIAALAIVASGCASVDDVKHAQATADEALAAAQAAQKSSDQNRTDINTLNQKVDEMEMSRHHHGGERG
jgi:PBP1b-binding outer membrane lipoprotein LpoB